MHSFSTQFYSTSIVSSSEEETSPVKVQEVSDNKMAEGKDTTKEKKDKASKGKGVKDWTEDEVSMLTELLEERPSFWDVFNKDYSKRDVKDAVCKEKAGVFGCNVTSINGLRAQYGREMAKVNKTTSGQSTGELYVRNWAHYQSLSFFATCDKVLKQ